MTEATTADKQHAQSENTQSDHPVAESMDICKNCQTPLNGPFCHQCGQPAKSIIRFFGSLVHELLEDIINLDSRAVRTLIALLFRPGYLTREYISGKRFRYVPPLRLFLITSLFCIAMIWVINKTSNTGTFIINGQTIEAKDGRLNEEQRNKILTSLSDKPLAELTDEERQKVRNKLDDLNETLRVSGHVEPLGIPDELLTNEEKARPLDSASVDEDVEPSKPSPATGKATNKNKGISVHEDGKVKVDFNFLSEEENQQLGEKLSEKFNKLKDAEERKDFFGDLLELVPKTMLLFVPIFALFIKVCYPFARRYYIEHLIHAFHGHAFLFLSIILIIALNLLDESLSVSDNGVVSFIGGLAGFMGVTLFIWIPVYFLLSLRKVYQQHWALTVMKWFMLGIIYLFFFVFSAVLVLVLSVLYN